jgi:O-methyltransferase domain/Dimerisation domain
MPIVDLRPAGSQQSTELTMSQRDIVIPPPVTALGLATAYQASQALIVAVKLGIPDVLGKGAMSSAEIARETRSRPDTMLRLLRALAAFDVVKDLGTGQFELTAVGDCLRADVPNSVHPLILLYASETFWQTSASLAECVRTGKNAFQLLHGMEALFTYLEKQTDLARIFDEAMTGRSSITGQAVAEAYDFRGVGRVVDVAGGRGKMLAAILKANPQLRGTLFDLPRVVENASNSLITENVADRCKIVGGDMFASVPHGGDLYLLSRVIHDWDDPRALEVLRSCRHAMGPKTKLLILDRVMPERFEASPLAESHALLDLTMMMFTGGGRERTAKQFEALVSAADLRLERIIPMRIPDSLIEAQPN